MVNNIKCNSNILRLYMHISEHSKNYFVELKMNLIKIFETN